LPGHGYIRLAIETFCLQISVDYLDLINFSFGDSTAVERSSAEANKKPGM